MTRIPFDVISPHLIKRKGIKAKHYPDSFKGYSREIILVGITYDKETKKHICKIEKIPIE